MGNYGCGVEIVAFTHVFRMRVEMAGVLGKNAEADSCMLGPMGKQWDSMEVYGRDSALLQREHRSHYTLLTSGNPQAMVPLSKSLEADLEAQHCAKQWGLVATKCEGRLSQYGVMLAGHMQAQRAQLVQQSRSEPDSSDDGLGMFEGEQPVARDASISDGEDNPGSDSDSSDSSEETFVHRERPHIVFDENMDPSWLVSGVAVGGAPHELYRGKSLTLVQAVGHECGTNT